MIEWTPQIVIAALSLIGVIVGATLTYKAKRKMDAVSASQAERRDTVADRDALIDRMNEDLKRHNEEIKELRGFALREPFYISYILALRSQIETGKPPPPIDWPEPIRPA